MAPSTSLKYAITVEQMAESLTTSARLVGIPPTDGMLGVCGRGVGMHAKAEYEEEKGNGRGFPMLSDTFIHL